MSVKPLAVGIPQPLAPAELAKLMGCSRPVIDAELKKGTIPYTRLGRRIFIPHRVAAALLNGDPVKQAAGVAPNQNNGRGGATYQMERVSSAIS